MRKVVEFYHKSNKDGEAGGVSSCSYTPGSKCHGEGRTRSQFRLVLWKIADRSWSRKLEETASDGDPPLACVSDVIIKATFPPKLSFLKAHSILKRSNANPYPGRLLAPDLSMNVSSQPLEGIVPAASLTDKSGNLRIPPAPGQFGCSYGAATYKHFPGYHIETICKRKRTEHFCRLFCAPPGLPLGHVK